MSACRSANGGGGGGGIGKRLMEDYSVDIVTLQSEVISEKQLDIDRCEKQFNFKIEF